MTDYLDANVVIYLVEQDPAWGPKARHRLATLRSAGDRFAISDAHRLECLVGPLARQDAASVADYNAFFSDPAIEVIPISAAVWEQAARIRAQYGFRQLDSLHLAAALEAGCCLFLANDLALAKYPGIPIEILA